MSYKTLYDVLQVSRHADPETIRAAYRSLVQRYHPDKKPDNPDADKCIKEINHAYKMLSDPAKRAEYDAVLAKSDELHKSKANATTRSNEAKESQAEKPKDKSDIPQWTQSEKKDDKPKRNYGFIFIVIVLAIIWVSSVIKTSDRDAHKNYQMSSNTPSAAVPNMPKAVETELFRDCSGCPIMVPISGRNYEIGKFEVTQGEWKAVMGNKPITAFKNCGDNCPVEKWSMEDIQMFLQKLNAKSGKQYRLPTEAEWEYACYGGSKTEYCGSNNIDSVAWFGNSGEPGGNSGQTVHPVGQKQPNAFGLHDMSGNVWERVQVCYNADCSHIMFRGGSWCDRPQLVSADSREWMESAACRFAVHGIRLARTLYELKTNPVVPDIPSAKIPDVPSSVVADNRVNTSALPFKGCPDCPEMVPIPGRSYEMGKYEVTQKEWRKVMGNNPSNFKNCGDNCPVENVSWDDLQTFLQKLNTKTGKQYRLPTEDEWEYACYGGSKTEYCGGNNPDEVAWNGKNSGFTTHPVGQKQANGYGLYDMSGNVWERVQDGRNVGLALRGGSWGINPAVLRTTIRFNGIPASQYGNIGFRVVRTLP